MYEIFTDRFPTEKRINFYKVRTLKCSGQVDFPPEFLQYRSHWTTAAGVSGTPHISSRFQTKFRMYNDCFKSYRSERLLLVVPMVVTLKTMKAWFSYSNTESLFLEQIGL